MKKHNMKTTELALILVFASLLICSLGLISADRTVNYNVNYAIIEDNDALTTTATAVNGVNATVYVCATVNCTSVGSIVGRFYSGDSSNILSLVFPETLQSTNGYVVYVYKPGYIGWEQSNVIRYGNGTVNSSTIFYLSKKRNGYAPIMNLSVTEEIPTNRPIRIGFNVSIDADTYSAIQRSTRSNVPLNEQVQTLVSLEIVNSSSSVIYRANQTLYIPYSGIFPVSFDYSGFSNLGQYTVNVYTDVPDAKILNSNRQTASANIQVINASASNYTYTLIQNLQASPALPVQGDNVLFSFNYLSGYVNSSGSLFPSNTILNMTVTRDSNVVFNNLVLSNSSGSYSFNQTFATAGFYRVIIVGSPNDTRGSATYPSSQEMTFVVNFNSTNNGTINNTDPDDDDDEDSDTYIFTRGSTHSIEYESLPLTMPGNSTITLGETETKAGYRIWFAWLLALTILLLIAVILVYVFKFVLANE